MDSARDRTGAAGRARPGTAPVVPFERGPFAGLGADDLRTLHGLGTRRVYSHNEALMIEGEPGDRVVVLLTGWVKVVAATEDGGEALLAIRQPGELVGELAVLDGEPRSAGVLAVRTSTTREIGAAAFLDYLADRPAAALALQRSVTRKLRLATRYVSSQGSCGRTRAFGRRRRAILRQPRAGCQGPGVIRGEVRDILQQWHGHCRLEPGADAGRTVLRRFDLLTEALGLDRPRAAGWTLARVLQNALWDIGDGRTALEPTQTAIATALLRHRRG